MKLFPNPERPTLSQRAQIAAGLPVTHSKALKFDTSAQAYPGVLLQEGRFRIIVSPRGANYVAQLNLGTDWVNAFHPVAVLSMLQHQLHALSLGEWPPAILSAVDHLDFEPKFSSLVPVPETEFS